MSVVSDSLPVFLSLFTSSVDLGKFPHFSVSQFPHL